MVLLLALAALVLKTPVRWVFGWANEAVEHMLRFSQQGAAFVFGPLADSKSFGFVFAFQVLPTIVFFSALMSAAYQLGVMPWIVRVLGRLLSRAIGVSGLRSATWIQEAPWSKGVPSERLSVKARPPMRLPASSTRTVRPSASSRRAAAMPAAPAPTTSTSTS